MKNISQPLQRVSMNMGEVTQSNSKIPTNAELFETTTKLKEQVQDGLSYIEIAKKDIETTKTITFFGFLILIFMLGAMIYSAMIERKSSYDNLLYKVSKLETLLDIAY